MGSPRCTLRRTFPQTSPLEKKRFLVAPARPGLEFREVPFTEPQERLPGDTVQVVLQVDLEDQEFVVGGVNKPYLVSNVQKCC